MQKIVLSQENHGFGQIGGSVRRDDPDLWPLAPDTHEPMTPLGTFTETFLPTPVLPPGMAATVFITARKRDGWFNQSVIGRYARHEQSALPEIHNGYTRVILHRLCEQELPVPPDTLLLKQPLY